MKQARVLLLSSLTVLLCSWPAQAQPSAAKAADGMVPPLIQFSSVATDEAGNSLSGVATIIFSLYDRQQEGEALWTEIQNVQLDSTGHYSVQLGMTKPAGMPATLFTRGETRWLGVRIGEQAEQPRVMLVSVPYALKAGDAATIDGLPPSAFARAVPETGQSEVAVGNSASPQSVRPAVTGTGTVDYIPLWLSSTKLGSSKLYQTGGNVGVGTKTPGAALDVNGAINAASGYNIAGTTFAFGFDGNAFLGFAGNPTISDTGETGNTGVGSGAFRFVTYGSSNTALGAETLESNAGNGNTATGWAALFSNTEGNYNTGIGLEALQYSTQGSYNSALGFNAGQIPGITSGTTGNNNTALGSNTEFGSGSISNATAIGANAEVASSNAIVLGSIKGLNGATASVAVGVGTTAPVGTLDVVDNGSGGNTITASAAATGASAVFATNSATSGSANGGFFTTKSPAGSAVVGINYGSGGADSAGYFQGNVSITGSLSKGSGSFKIDHPLDPANKYLYHSFVESPDMMNIYNGVAQLDARGSIWITLPNYFEALNQDFRYQLTSIGRPQPSLYVAKEISHNRFRISGGKPGGKVSWQVTGIRHDAYADAHRIQVEEEKPPQEQGHYLHPELFGAPAERAVGYQAPPVTGNLPTQGETAHARR
ncbi:MAG: hypothetical protein WBS24_08635 [Terriglobales bacterium]